MPRKPKISPRKPPAASDLQAFVEGGAASDKPDKKRPKTTKEPEAQTTEGSDLHQRSRSPNVYMPERKRGWLAGEAPRRCTFYLPQELFEALRRRCFEADVELSAFVTEAVRDALKK